MTQPIVIPLGAELPAADERPDAASRAGRGGTGGAALMRISKGWWSTWRSPTGRTPTRAARGRVIEVLGAEDEFGVDVEMVIRKHHLPRVFPEAVLAGGARSGAFRCGDCGGAARFSRAADCDHRWRDGARLRRCGAGAARRGWGLGTAGSHCGCGAVCAAGDGARSGGAAARDVGLFSGSRDSDAAAGAVDGHLQPAAG